jgi:hypothetical protein
MIAEPFNDVDIIVRNIEKVACSTCRKYDDCEDRGTVYGCKLVGDLYDQGAFYAQVSDENIYPDEENDIEDI